MRAPVFHGIVRCAVLVAIFAGASGPGGAEPRGVPQQFPTPPNPTTRPGGPGSAQHDAEEDDPVARHMSAQMAKSRNAQRQQQLMADTAKLLQLATDLKAEVDKSDKDTLSLAVVKRAEEIEKLAKSVKERMRDAP